ncbi:MAG: adenylate/guanylate cyclase domain-containing protein [Candidatus Acidiferrales bacterium]
MATSIREKITGIIQGWWQHRGSLAISFVITIAALAVYYVTFIGERPMPLFDFVTRLELDSLDTRFRLRGRTPVDPRIVIVDIDQHSQEVLGHWPFPRIYFAKLLDTLREEDARVAAFDITFSQPDETAKPLQILYDQLKADQKRGLPANPKLMARITQLEEQFDYDKQFAEAIRKFGRVVLGNYFLYTQADLHGVTEAQLQHYANLMAFFPFPEVRPLPSAKGKADVGQLISVYESTYLLPRGAEANTDTLNEAIVGERGGCGFFNVVPDADGAVRRPPLALPYGLDPDPKNWDVYASIDVQALRMYLALKNEQVVLNYSDAGVAFIEFGPKLVVRTDHIARAMVNFHGPARTYPYISFADAALGKFPRGSFKDKIVLVGASATGIGDLRVTPFGSLDYPGVEIHANMIDNMLNQQFLARGVKQALVDIGWIFLFGIPLGMWLAVVQPRWMTFGFVLLAPFGAVVYWAFLHGWWLNVTVPALFTLVPNISLVGLYRVLVEEQEKRKVRGAFQQYVSPEVIRRLLIDPERVKPRKTEITVLFSDIRGFTTISEKLDAQELADLLNGYLTQMTRVVFRHQGTLDKYIGDAVMAIWGAPFDEPGHATRCCEGAIEMLTRLAEMQKEWRARNQPVLEIGIGINTGIASVGNMGSALRYGYTAMGDTVNLASRLEGLNKEYGTHIIISDSTRAALNGTQILIRELDLIRVKGKLQPVTIHEILPADITTEAGKEAIELVELFGRGREAYKQRHWSIAKRIFDDVLRRWPDDGPARIFLERAEEYLAEEPADAWDGVYVMKHK